MVDKKLLRKVFDDLDLDNNGVLTPNEISEGMYKLGFPIDQKELEKQTFESMDYDRSGQVSFDEFVRYVEQRHHEFYEMFESIAQTRSWTEFEEDSLIYFKAISRSDIRMFLNKYKIKATDKQINAFLNLIDENSEGVISFQEFQAFFALLPKANPAAIFEAFKYTAMVEHAHDELRIPRQVYRDEEKSQYYKLVSGAIAGFVSRTMTAPIDRLRIMMQFKPPGSTKMTFFGGLQQIYKEDKIIGFFKGNGINCMKKIPEIAIKFYTFDFLLNEFSSKKHTTTNFERILSGGIAGGIGQFCVYPLDMARVRFALAPTNYYKSLLDCIMTIIRQEGITKLYAGLVPTLIGIFPYSGIDIGVYSIIKLQYCKHFQHKNQEPTVGNLLISSGIASSIALIATAPIHIVRTRLQSNGLNPVSKRFKGPMDVVVRTWNKEGIQGFYRGTLPSLVKTMPATSLSYIVYEKLNKFFKSRFEE